MLRPWANLEVQVRQRNSPVGELKDDVLGGNGVSTPCVKDDGDVPLKAISGYSLNGNDQRGGVVPDAHSVSRSFPKQDDRTPYIIQQQKESTLKTYIYTVRDPRTNEPYMLCSGRTTDVGARQMKYLVSRKIQERFGHCPWMARSQEICDEGVLPVVHIEGSRTKDSEKHAFWHELLDRYPTIMNRVSRFGVPRRPKVIDDKVRLYSVYTLWHEGVLRYVGQSVHATVRLPQHICMARYARKHNKNISPTFEFLLELDDQGLRPELRVENRNLTRQEAFDLEWELIQKNLDTVVNSKKKNLGGRHVKPGPVWGRKNH
jgi:hypothetical protein